MIALADNICPIWRLEQADCMRLMPMLPAGSVSAVITDPPYGVAYRSKRMGGIANDRAPYVWWMAEAYRVLPRTAPILCFCRWDVAEAFRLALTWAGFRVRNCIVWDREYGGTGDCARTLAPSHDFCWLATKGDWRRPQGAPRIRDLVRAKKVHNRAAIHPTQKPLDLMRTLVRATTAPGDLVFDPFAGSGSTGEACLLEGRRFFGVELDPSHAAVARTRLDRMRPENTA